MSAQREELSDLNRVAIQEFRRLVETDQTLSEPWKKITLDLTEDRDVPISLTDLEALLKKGK
jgi:hypothetical protein